MTSVILSVFMLISLRDMGCCTLEIWVENLRWVVYFVKNCLYSIIKLCWLLYTHLLLVKPFFYIVMQLLFKPWTQKISSHDIIATVIISSTTKSNHIKIQDFDMHCYWLKHWVRRNIQMISRKTKKFREVLGTNWNKH